MRKGTIYIIKNYKNDKVYVGQTTLNLQERFIRHLNASKIKKGKLYQAIKEFGKDSFYIEPLETDIEPTKLDEREIYYISKFDSYRNGYNSTVGGNGEIINKVEDKNKIVEMYLSGKSTNMIAKEYGVVGCTISKVLHQLNFETRHDGNKYESFDLDQFKSLWFSKTKLKDMAALFGVHKTTLQRHASRLGLPRKG